MKTFDAKRIAALKEKYAKAGYVRKVWTVDEEQTLTLEEFAEYINPMYKHVEKAEIIEKEYTDKNGKDKTFLKVEFSFKGGTRIEWDLPYNNDDELEFDEGDVLDLSTIKFCSENCLEESHEYAIGELANE